MVSDVANKSLENKYTKKEELENNFSEQKSSERIEPSFKSFENAEENTLNNIDSSTSSIQDSNYTNIPSFLRRNRD